MALTNLYHQYYRGYYDKSLVSKKEEGGRGHDKASVTRANKLFCTPLPEGLQANFDRLHSSLHACATHVITGTVSGSGFLAGTGYPHESYLPSKSDINDAQMGLSLHYSSGVPWLPGTSLKGILRSAMWPGSAGGKQLSKVELEAARMHRLICDVVAEHGDEAQPNPIATRDWNRYLFTGFHPNGDKRLSPTLQVAFLGAAVGFRENEPLFQLLHLAPQAGPTKKPIPIPYFSVAPGAEMSVYLQIPAIPGSNEHAQHIEQTTQVMAYHLAERGLGAKTRYGYGRLTNLSVTCLREDLA